jgi:hypothetical protein
VDPLLQAINESATRLPTTDMAVYLLNCMYQMQSTLSLYEFMDERLERLQVCVTTVTIAQAHSLQINSLNENEFNINLSVITRDNYGDLRLIYRYLVLH